MTFARYTYNNPDALPVHWDCQPLGLDWDETCRQGGFDPDDEEVTLGLLSEPWEGHPAGAVVISGCTVEGHPFAVSFEPHPE